MKVFVSYKIDKQKWVGVYDDEFILKHINGKVQRFNSAAKLKILKKAPTWFFVGCLRNEQDTTRAGYWIAHPDNE